MTVVKLVANINKNPQSFLELSHVQKEVLPSHKLQVNLISNEILSD